MSTELGRIMTGGGQPKSSATCFSATMFICGLFNHLVHNSDYSSK